MKKTNNRSILFSSIIVTIATFTIKFLGLLKQSVIAACCGANANTDAFFVATGIIGQLAVVVFSAISITLLSMYTRERATASEEEANKLINSTLFVFLPISAALSVAFFMLSKPIAFILAPTYTHEQLRLLIHYIRIMSVAFIPWCYYLSVNVVLEANNSFIPGKGQGFFQNVFLILAAVFLFPKLGMDVLVYAFLLSGITEALFVTACAKKYYSFRISNERCNTVIKNILPVAIPLILGNAIYEVNDIVDKQISLSLGEGYASILTYGATVNEIVTGVIVASVATVMFANFSTWAAVKHINKIIHNLELSINYLTLLIVPIMVLCVAAGDQIVSILYGRGSFGANEIKSTYYVVIGYALGFVFQSIRAILVKVFYAFQDTKTPLVNGIISITVNIVLSIVLSHFIGVMGIALATSFGMLVVTVLLFIHVDKYLNGINYRMICAESCKAIAAGIIAIVPVILIKKNLNAWLMASFTCEGVTCLFVYFGVLWLIKSTTCHSLISLLNNKLKR